MMCRALLAAWLALGLLLPAGCQRGPTSQPTKAPASRPARTALRDWVLDPPVAEPEHAVPALRLLSAGPNVTEICCALGLERCLVGRTRYCTYPPQIESVPSIGALNDLNVEVLLGLRADLVVVSGRSRAISERLARLEVRYESVPDVSLADLFTGIERIGRWTGRPETAERLIAGVRADLEAVARRFAGGPHYRVLLAAAPLSDPPSAPTVNGPGSFYDDLLRRVGHSNAAEAGGRPFAPLSLEFLLRADPDVIIELAPGQRDRPGGDAEAARIWAQIGPLKAVAGQRVYVLRGPEHFVLGPRIAVTFEALCRLIAGEQQ